jgi:hypothetical protein
MKTDEPSPKATAKEDVPSLNLQVKEPRKKSRHSKEVKSDTITEESNGTVSTRDVQTKASKDSKELEKPEVNLKESMKAKQSKEKDKDKEEKDSALKEWELRVEKERKEKEERKEQAKAKKEQEKKDRREKRQSKPKLDQLFTKKDPKEAQKKTATKEEIASMLHSTMSVKQAHPEKKVDKEDSSSSEDLAPVSPRRAATMKKSNEPSAEVSKPMSKQELMDHVSSPRRHGKDKK